ncbi:Brp/Blh family beta-carotene 15,15'-dioxygenase [Pirellulaceae bacterium SH449]
MHTQLYLGTSLAICIGMLMFGEPSDYLILLFTSLSVALLGVPHGGLDHWVGKRLLYSKLGSLWWLVFFPMYLIIGAIFTAGWYRFPVITVVTFFVLSAWHFGREDERASESGHSKLSLRGFPKLFNVVSAISLGGIVIWVPVLARSHEFAQLLTYIVPAQNRQGIGQIVFVTQILAVALLPIAAVSFSYRAKNSASSLRSWIPIATTITAIIAPILVTFTLFFCGWHSLQGLSRLRSSESLTHRQFLRHVAPLSLAAIGGIGLFGWWYYGATIGNDTALLQMTFIGLSAIAIPHLVVHEIDSFINNSTATQEQFV